jgi:hypothetical protein
MKKGWFKIEGVQDGDRTIDEQMTGLGQLLKEVPGKTVLDVGAGEGLISMELAKAGAKFCKGLEIVDWYIPVAKTLAGDLPCEFQQANLNHYAHPEDERYDIIVMLASLHKLKNPSAVCSMLAAACDDLVVIRLPPYGPVIRDLRSENVPHDILAVMASEGFDLETEGEGPRGEWQGYFRRRVQETPKTVHVEADVSTETEVFDTMPGFNAMLQDAAAEPVALDVTTMHDAEPVTLQPEVTEPQQDLLPDATSQEQERPKRKYTRRGA